MKRFDTCNVLGTELAVTNMKEEIEYIDKFRKELSGEYFCYTNVHVVMEAYDRPEFRAVLQNAYAAMPDGAPLSVVGRKIGYSNMKRVTGPDSFGEFLRLSAKKGYRNYFYGSTKETLDKLRKQLEQTYPGIIISGMYSPPFRKLTVEEDKKIVEQINESNSDFVWVGLGAPKQEQWMYEHKGKLQGICFGVGAAFDFYAGNVKRAPKWMQRCYLEWLYRLIKNPDKLFKRYMRTNPRFILLSIKQIKEIRHESL